MKAMMKWIYASVAVLVIGCIIFATKQGKSTSVSGDTRTPESQGSNSESPKGAEKAKADPGLPLSEEEKKKLAKALEDRGINTQKPSSVYLLGEVEVREVYNSDFVWTKDILSEAMTETELTSIPIRRLDFFSKKSGKTIAQFSLNALDTHCESKILLANIDSTTPWPELLYLCSSNGTSGSADMFVMSVNKDSEVTLNMQFVHTGFEEEMQIKTSGKIKKADPQEDAKFLLAALNTEFLFVNRRTGRATEEPPQPGVPVYYAFQMPGSRSLYHCEQCTLRPYSLVSFENGIWKDANGEPGARKWFANSLREIDTELKKIETGKYQDNGKSFEMRSKNESLFLKLAHSIRVGKAADAWREINNRFSKSVYGECKDKEEDCPNPDWRLELKKDLDERGFETKELKI
jgi:hypothetical protein